MKNRLITCAFALCMLHAFGQSPQEEKRKHMMDSIREKYIDRLAWKNPVIRQAGVSTEVFAPGDMKSDLYGNSFFKSRFQTVRTNAYFSVPIVHIKKNIFSAGFAVSHQTMQLYDVTSYDPSLQVPKMQVQNTLLSTSLTYTRVDSLFHRPVVYSVSASGLIDAKSAMYRLGFTAVISVTVVQTKRSTLSLGLMVIIDPSVPVPVIPFISYYHQFKSPGLEFFLDPSRIALRKELNSRNSISLSNNIGGNLSLFKREITNLPIQQAYSTLEIKSGLVYEHLLANKMVLSLSAGVNNTFTSKVLEANKYTGDPFIKNTQSMVPYVKAGVSFLPFWKGIIH